MSKLAVAQRFYVECLERRIHYRDVPRYLEEHLTTEAEEIHHAIEVYIRYNLYDRSLQDTDIDYAKELLIKAK